MKTEIDVLVGGRIPPHPNIMRGVHSFQVCRLAISSTLQRPDTLWWYPSWDGRQCHTSSQTRWIKGQRRVMLFSRIPLGVSFNQGSGMGLDLTPEGR